MANLTINDGGIVINTRNIASADLRYGPYGSVGEARSATAGVEADGLTVGVYENGEIVDYWYRLIPENSDGQVILDLVRKTPKYKTVNGESILGNGNIPIEFADGTEIFNVGIDDSPNLNNNNNIVTSRGIALAIKELQDQIIEISKDIYPLVVEFDSSLDSPVTFTGNDIITRLTWRASIDKIPVAPDSVVIKQDDEIIYELDQSADEPPYEHGTVVEGYVDATVSKYGTTVFSIEATAKGMVKRGEILFNVVLPSYVGFYSDKDAELIMMKPSLLAETVDSVDDLSGEYVLSGPAPAYLTVAVPFEFSITEITSSGFLVPLMVQGPNGEYEKEDTSIRISGRPVKYKIYRSLNKIEQGLMTIKVD